MQRSQLSLQGVLGPSIENYSIHRRIVFTLFGFVLHQYVVSRGTGELSSADLRKKIPGMYTSIVFIEQLYTNNEIKLHLLTLLLVI